MPHVKDETFQTGERFPIPRTCPIHPPEAYKDFRKAGPKKVKLWNGNLAWLVTSYKDVRAILSDKRFSSVATSPGYPTVSPAREIMQKAEPTFIRLDPPRHTELRRMVTKEFMIKQVEAAKPRLQVIVDGLLDEIAATGTSMELVHQFAFPLTGTVISELLGVPDEDSMFFQSQTGLRMQMNGDPEVARKATTDVISYIDKLLTAKESDPGEGKDLLSRLVLEQIRPGHLSHDDAVRMADLMLLGGHETTANQIALGVLSFIQNPDQRALLFADPALIRNAVDEMLRFHTVNQYNNTRVAIDDVEISGQLIRKGEGVIALINAANRDPEVFEDPDRIDITRSINNHLAFGFGVHQCLGQTLARAELQIAYTTIFKRFPGLKLAVPEEELQFKVDSFVYGLEKLPLTW